MSASMRVRELERERERGRECVCVRERGIEKERKSKITQHRQHHSTPLNAAQEIITLHYTIVESLAAAAVYV